MTIALPWWRTTRRPSATLSTGLTLSVAASEAAAAVTLSGLGVSYGRQKVIDGLDWSLQPGQVVGLLGRNGAGKTTLLESMLGLRDPLSGAVTLFGQRADTLDDAARSRIGYVPQRSDLFEELRADELLAYFRSFYPRWNADKVNALLDRWSVPRDLPIGRMSGGEQQRLSIIRALAHEPDLLVLDEPVASLDPLARRDFLRELVERVLDRGTTVVFSTHILSDLERVAFNVAFLRSGRIVLQAPLDTLLDEVLEVRGPAAALGALQTPAVLARTADAVLLRGLDEASLPAGLLAQRVNLESLFEALT
jgi:ABC-2 type transport system ATP-binding protein